MTLVGIVFVLLGIVGTACDVVEHRRLQRSGVRPQLRGPYR